MPIDILQQCPKNLSALRKGSLCPLRLSSSRNPNDFVDIFNRGGLDSVPEHPPIGRTVARNQFVVPFLYSRRAISAETRKRIRKDQAINSLPELDPATLFSAAPEPHPMS